jgi:hypothetical protein
MAMVESHDDEPTHNLIEELNLMSKGELCTFIEAEQDAAWQATMQEEIDSIKQNKPGSWQTCLRVIALSL